MDNFDRASCWCPRTTPRRADCLPPLTEISETNGRGCGFSGVSPRAPPAFVAPSSLWSDFDKRALRTSPYRRPGSIGALHQRTLMSLRIEERIPSGVTSWWMTKYDWQARNGVEQAGGKGGSNIQGPRSTQRTGSAGADIGEQHSAGENHLRRVCVVWTLGFSLPRASARCYRTDGTFVREAMAYPRPVSRSDHHADLDIQDAE